MKYGKKTKSTVPVYGPDAKDAKLKPVKPIGPGQKVDEATDVIKSYQPGKSVEVTNQQTGVTTSVDLQKSPGAIRPGEQGQLEFDPTPAVGTTGATSTPTQIQPGMTVTNTDKDAKVSEANMTDQQYMQKLEQLRSTPEGKKALWAALNSTDPNALNKLVGFQLSPGEKTTPLVVPDDQGTLAPRPQQRTTAPRPSAPTGTAPQPALVRETADLEAMLRIAGLR